MLCCVKHYCTLTQLFNFSEKWNSYKQALWVRENDSLTHEKNTTTIQTCFKSKRPATLWNHVPPIEDTPWNPSDHHSTVVLRGLRRSFQSELIETHFLWHTSCKFPGNTRSKLCVLKWVTRRWVNKRWDTMLRYSFYTETNTLINFERYTNMWHTILNSVLVAA